MGLWKPAECWKLPPNPYKNHTRSPSGLEYLKLVVVGLTLFLPRVILVVLTILIVWILSKITVAGWPVGDKMRLDRPLPKNGWRRMLQRAVFPYMVRLNLFAAGFHWIKVKGRKATRQEAPIVVCNHQGFPDIWWFIWDELPVGVSAAENMRFPVMGDIMLSQQTIFVDREARESGQSAADKILKIVQNEEFPKVVIYPEGNTSNGRQIAGFKLGAFQPGVPVQPIVIRYPNTRLDVSWVEPLGLPVHVVALRMLLQFHNFMEVEYLPVLSPTDAEKANPALFAARAQRVMAAALGVPVTEHTFADTRLLFAARRLKVPMEGCVLEMDKVQRLWGVSFSDARDALERFAAAVGPGVATMDSESLVRGLALGELEATPEVRRQLLETFSQGEAEAGEITYREWVAGLAPLAAIAAQAGSKETFVYRAVATLRKSYLHA